MGGDHLMKRAKPYVVILMTILLLYFGWEISNYSYGTNDDLTTPNQSAEEGNNTDGIFGESGEDNLADFNLFPTDSDLQRVVENEGYILKADPKTGHFVVENKENGGVIKSFPNPDVWNTENTNETWQLHLRSPFTIKYVEFNERVDIVKEFNFFNRETNVEYEEIENGYKVTYEIPDIGFVIPIQVILEGNYVETKILTEAIIDEKEYPEGSTERNRKARLVSMRLFPFLGADSSDNEDGFIFLPDGSGVLLDFKEDRPSIADPYRERIYGNDLAFATNRTLSSRLPVRMPVFGIKSGDQAVLGVITEGDTYANIESAPSGTLTKYNWVTGEHLFRFQYFQPTNRRRTSGFFTYSEEMQGTERSIRYYMLDGDPDYVDLAAQYRQYLMDEKGLEKRKLVDDDIELNLNILGGGVKEGFILDSYLSLTTMDQAESIVEWLEALGIDNMSITYHGWQSGGYGTYGGYFPVARQLGGNSKMKSFVDFSHAKGYPVYLDASIYSYNNNGKGGFRSGRDGLQDLSSSVVNAELDPEGNTVLLSPYLMKETIFKDLNKVKDLGIDGYLFGEGIGSNLSTDYNERYLADRHEVKEIQREIFRKINAEFNEVRVASGNFYTLGDSSYMGMLDKGYSYDLFVDRVVPFAQITLHGMVDYSLDYANMSGNARESLLKGIEYGASPSFMVTASDPYKVLESEALSQYYSTNYTNWETQFEEQYGSYNDALSDVQDQFITNHRQLAGGVFETTYENGKRIIVNYNTYQYEEGDVVVEPQDYSIIEGEE